MKQIILEYHRANHASFMKTLLLLKRSFYFSRTDRALARLCEDFIKACHVCQAVKKKSNAKQGTLDYVPIPDDIFSSLCMDFVQLPACKDLDDNIVDSVLVVVCRLSGYTLGIPCRKDGLTAQKMAHLYLQQCCGYLWSTTWDHWVIVITWLIANSWTPCALSLE